MVIKYKVPEDRPWFNGKYWPKGVPHQLDIDYELALPSLLDRAVKNWGNNPCIWFLESWVTYKELADMVYRLATFLASKGLKKGDVVASVLPNSIQYVVAYYAVTKIGAIISGVSPVYKANEVLHQCKTVNAKYLIVLDSLYGELVEPFIADGRWNFDLIVYSNVADNATGLSNIKKKLGKILKKIPTGKVNHPKAVAWLDALKTAPNPPTVSINPAEDPATYIMTGGTTGVPKAAILTHENVFANAKQCEALLVNQKEKESDPTLGPLTGMLGVLPFFHSFGMTTIMNVCIASGSWMMLFPRPPAAEELVKEISTIMLPNGQPPNGICYCGAEILFKRLADLPQEVIDKYPVKGRLKLCMSGAGPLHEYVRVPFEKKTGAPLSEGYGLTESSPVITVNNFFGAREPGFIGVPVPGVDVAIFDAGDFSKGPITALGQEGTGEICASGPQIMKGYLGKPTEELQKYDGKIWLLTGDIGFMDKEGRFAIRDRKKQLIKMSGHSVFPAEVEQMMGEHPAVAEAAVAGLPDQKTGEAVKAWVVLKPGATATPQELIDWAKKNYTEWKCPKYVDIIKEIPKNAIGKVQRRALQEVDPLFKKTS